jgi:xanthine dehydrogenase iron-sulfur cluster and FAD-binding subunit A
MNEMTNSHILIQRFDYLEPASLQEAIRLLAQYGKDARILAGGTDLLVHMKLERATPKAVISINGIPGLNRIVSQDGHLRLGALTTIRRLAADSRVRTLHPALAEACDSFSTIQVQTMGTLGGNLGNGSPAADSAPALIVLSAQAEIVGPDGMRSLPVEDFFAGPGKTALQNGELLAHVILPHPRPGTGRAFLKIARVAADIAKASAAVMLVRDGDRIVDCRMAFGSVAPTPMRSREAERALTGRVFSEENVEHASRLAGDEVAPIDDVRSAAWYRREAVRVLARDGLNRAWQRAGGRSDQPGEESRTGAAEERETSGPPNGGIGRLAADEKRWIELSVNGTKHPVWVGPNDLLLNVLREQLQLTGTKYGCGIGECGACTVQLDGRPVLACLVLAVSAAGHDILTVEGLQKPNGELDPLQEAFLDFAAYQCGYCTPGMLLTAKSLLEEKPEPTEEDVRAFLRGNLCRCTGYASIVRAVMGCATARNSAGRG